MADSIEKLKHRQRKLATMNYIFVTGDKNALKLGVGERRYTPLEEMDGAPATTEHRNKLYPSCEPVLIPLELVIGCPKCQYNEADGALFNHCKECQSSLMTHVYAEVCKTHEMV